MVPDQTKPLKPMAARPKKPLKPIVVQCKSAKKNQWWWFPQNHWNYQNPFFGIIQIFNDLETQNLNIVVLITNLSLSHFSFSYPFWPCLQFSLSPHFTSLCPEKWGLSENLQCKNGQIGKEDPLNFIKIKNPFGCFQTNLMADDWWVPPIQFLKKLSFWTP